MKPANYKHESFSITSANHEAILPCLLSGDVTSNNMLHQSSRTMLAHEARHFMTHSYHMWPLFAAKAPAGVCTGLNDVCHSGSHSNKTK